MVVFNYSGGGGGGGDVYVKILPDNHVGMTASECDIFELKTNFTYIQH